MIPKRCLGPLSQTLKPWTPKSDVGHHGMMVPNREMVFWVAQPAISSFTKPRNDKSAINLSNYRYNIPWYYIHHISTINFPKLCHCQLVGTLTTPFGGWFFQWFRSESIYQWDDPHWQCPWYSGEIQPWCSHESPNEMELSNPWYPKSEQNQPMTSCWNLWWLD